MKRGRPKGHSPYTEISYEDLSDWVGCKTKIPVSKKWLQVLMGNETEDDISVDNSPKEVDTKDIDSKIEYTLTKFDNE
jgi:hypothetical protein